MASNDTEDETTVKLLAAIDSSNDSPDKKKKIKEWVKNRKKRLEILITGRTGAGKSTLVNALVGKKVATIGTKLQVETKEVTSYEVKTDEGVEIVVWDSPGLQDGSLNEEKYLAELKEKCNNVDIVIYCIDISATRSELASTEKEVQNDLCAIEKLTTTFGKEWWEHSIFVMTRANLLEARLKVRDDYVKTFNDIVEEWKTRIHAALLKAGVPKDKVDIVPVKPAGYPKKPHLPGRNYWLSALWFTFIKHAKKQSQPTLTVVNIPRLVTQSQVTPQDFKREPHEQPVISDFDDDDEIAAIAAGATSGAVGGALIGGVVGTLAGPLGTIVGAAVGGATGYVVGGTFGYAASLLSKLF